MSVSFNPNALNQAKSHPRDSADYNKNLQYAINAQQRMKLLSEIISVYVDDSCAMMCFRDGNERMATPISMAEANPAFVDQMQSAYKVFAARVKQKDPS